MRQLSHDEAPESILHAEPRFWLPAAVTASCCRLTRTFYRNLVDLIGAHGWSEARCNSSRTLRRADFIANRTWRSSVNGHSLLPARELHGIPVRRGRRHRAWAYLHHSPGQRPHSAGYRPSTVDWPGACSFLSPATTNVCFGDGDFLSCLTNSNDGSVEKVGQSFPRAEGMPGERVGRSAWALDVRWAGYNAAGREIGRASCRERVSSPV